MPLHMKTAASVTKSLESMLKNKSQRRKLRPLLEILGTLVEPQGADSPGFITTPFGEIKGRNLETVYETRREPEPSFIAWKVRWYRTGDIIYVIDIEH